jgi:uncharacterized membrane-anchored protein YhcB (DUF1043 family)
MSKYTAAFTGVFLLGVGIGVLLGRILPTSSRRERDENRRRLQCETASLRSDLDALRSEVGRLFARQTTKS